MAKDFATRMYGYTEKSVLPTNTAGSYDILLRSSINGIRTVSDHTRTHVGSLITSAQHRASRGDTYNTHMLIDNAVELMYGGVL